ncbi:MAG: triphosphoribosyl-dephospho-CoA synthase MdcB [Methylocella sp.]
MGALASQSLHLEVETWPKPGLVSHVDNGSHDDMDAAMLHRSADVLLPYFTALAQAGAEGEGMDRLRAIGVEAEVAMLAATGGVNTHRGAIFGLGLLCAAAGAISVGRSEGGETLGAIVSRRWSRAIAKGPASPHSHGAEAARRFGATGARGEAIAGFPGIYKLGAPALERGFQLGSGDPEAARVHALFALIAGIADTNILHRGGAEGLAFAQRRAKNFLLRGGVGAAGWREEAARIHREFVQRRLSPGGAADMLAMSLFVQGLDMQ